MNILGIDPGADGALAILYPDRALVVYRFKDKTVHDLRARFLEESLEPCTAFLEKVGARPGQGVTSMFTFGRKVGWMEALLAAYRIPFEEVIPQKWMMGVGAAGLKGEKADRKKALRAKAQQLFPAQDIPLAAADAVLIAEYGWRVTHGRLK